MIEVLNEKPRLFIERHADGEDSSKRQGMLSILELHRAGRGRFLPARSFLNIRFNGDRHLLCRIEWTIHPAVLNVVVRFRQASIDDAGLLRRVLVIRGGQLREGYRWHRLTL